MVCAVSGVEEGFPPETGVEELDLKNPSRKVGPQGATVERAVYCVLGFTRQVK